MEIRGLHTCNSRFNAWRRRKCSTTSVNRTPPPGTLTITASMIGTRGSSMGSGWWSSGIRRGSVMLRLHFSLAIQRENLEYELVILGGYQSERAITVSGCFNIIRRIRHPSRNSPHHPCQCDDYGEAPRMKTIRGGLGGVGWRSISII